jgi:D-tyrosyl-tRNA(Tyr) deacylase
MREPMSQQEHEAEVVESWREYFRTKHATDDKRHMDPRVALAQTFLNTIDRLRAKAAAYDTLRAACEGVPDMLYEASIQMEECMGSDQWQPVIAARAKAAALRAALAAPANGDGDGGTQS